MTTHYNYTVIIIIIIIILLLFKVAPQISNAGHIM